MLSIAKDYFQSEKITLHIKYISKTTVITEMEF